MAAKAEDAARCQKVSDPPPSQANNGLCGDSGSDSAATKRLAAAWPQLDPVVGIGRILAESDLYDLLASDDLEEGEGR